MSLTIIKKINELILLPNQNFRFTPQTKSFLTKYPEVFIEKILIKKETLLAHKNRVLTTQKWVLLHKIIFFKY